MAVEKKLRRAMCTCLPAPTAGTQTSAGAVRERAVIVQIAVIHSSSLVHSLISNVTEQGRYTWPPGSLGMSSWPSPQAPTLRKQQGALSQLVSHPSRSPPTFSSALPEGREQLQVSGNRHETNVHEGGWDWGTHRGLGGYPNECLPWTTNGTSIH